MVGNIRLLTDRGITVPAGISERVATVVVCAIAGKYAGHLLLSDTLKADAVEAIGRLKQLHIDNIQLLSGDKKEIVAIFAKTLGIRHARGGLLPEDKAAYLEKLNAEAGVSAAFVGDGMNDAPVLALSDVGIAMGGLGADAAIESADVVIQTDQPSKVATAISNRTSDPTDCKAEYCRCYRGEVTDSDCRCLWIRHFVGRLSLPMSVWLCWLY